MLRKNNKSFSYKLQTVHKLKEEDNDHRVEMGETLLNRFENNLSIIDGFWLSDQVVFHWSGRVNLRNT